MLANKSFEDGVVDQRRHLNVHKLCDDASFLGTFILKWMESDLSDSWSDITMVVSETAIDENSGTSSEPPNDKAQCSLHNLGCELSIATGIVLKIRESNDRWAHRKFPNMLHMQHHFLCFISYIVIAVSMGNSLKCTTKEDVILIWVCM